MATALTNEADNCLQICGDGTGIPGAYDYVPGNGHDQAYWWAYLQQATAYRNLPQNGNLMASDIDNFKAFLGNPTFDTPNQTDDPGREARLISCLQGILGILESAGHAAPHGTT
ncbi:hypothetical protein OG331_49320 [Streptomyces sp. NBC_01017]|uniref:hypothetical protein n=1 Tax=Streptomyces sp. NBC_01017 TaxID=2903721 RepID=UPI003867118A|nr:hypothetical protein OG331_02655 [Streptomyces sp. NBC_01017]WSV35004.1 hypothetical protein OG331_49320 [Streptomyces sp. NBC_01017]